MCSFVYNENRGIRIFSEYECSYSENSVGGFPPTESCIGLSQ